MKSNWKSCFHSPVQKPKWLLTSVRPGREEVGQPWYPQTTEHTLGANHDTNASGNLEAGARVFIPNQTCEFRKARFACFFFAITHFRSQPSRAVRPGSDSGCRSLEELPTWEMKSTFNWSKLFAIQAVGFFRVILKHKSPNWAPSQFSIPLWTQARSEDKTHHLQRGAHTL